MGVTVDPAQADPRAEVDRLPIGPVHRALRAVVDGWLAEPAEAWRVRWLLEGLRQGDAELVRMAFAPYDDEPLTEKERSALAEGDEDIRAGRVLPWSEARNRWLRP
jgi:hypothetical protein